MPDNVIPFVIQVEDKSVVIDIPRSPVRLSPETARALGERLISVADQIPAPGPEPGHHVPKPSEIAHPERSEVVPPPDPPPMVQSQLQRGDIRFSAKVMGYIERNGLDVDSLVRVVDDPDDTWMDPGGSGATIAVKQDHDRGVVHFNDGGEGIYVISVRDRRKLYDLRREAGSCNGGSPKGGPGTPAISSLDEFTKVARAAGLEVAPGGKHSKVYHPDNPSVSLTVPLTPSDHRTWMNLIAQVKNELGVDLRRA